MPIRYLTILILMFSCNTLNRSSADRSHHPVPIFNGSDLSGWTNVNEAPDVWNVENGSIVCSGMWPGNLRSEHSYRDFILEFEAQTLTTQGPAILIHASELPAPGSPLPSGILCTLATDKGTPNIKGINGDSLTDIRYEETNLPETKLSQTDWNIYKIVSKKSTVELWQNGNKVAQANANKTNNGFIAFVSNGVKYRIRNIQIATSGRTATDSIAAKAGRFFPLYNTADLASWNMRPGHEGHWTSQGWVINYDGKSTETDKCLWTKKSFRNFILVADVRLTRAPEPAPTPVILPDGTNALNEDGKPIEVLIPYAGDTGIYLRGNSKSQVNIGYRYVGSGEIYGYRVDTTLSPQVRAAVTPKRKADRPPGEWNRFIVTMKKDTVSVMLNGVTVIANAVLPGVPAEGPIALQDDHANNNLFQFANVFIKEL